MTIYSNSILGDKTPEKAFIGVNPEVSHLRIFGFPIYIHVHKEKILKMEPSRKKGALVGYSETSNCFRIHLLGQRYIEISPDVTFDEATFQTSRESHIDVDSEVQEAPRDADVSIPNNHPSDVQREEPVDPIDSVETVEPIDRMRDVVVAKRRPTWLRDTLQEVEKHAAPHGFFTESRKPQRFLSYFALMSHIIDSEPSNYKEATDQQEWRDAMMEEYQSIMKNDVWEIVSRPKGESMVTWRWIYKIKQASNGSIEKHKALFMLSGFSQKEGVDYEETFAQVARYTYIRAIISLPSMMGWRLHQMDVKTAFLNGVIEEVLKTCT